MTDYKPEDYIKYRIQRAKESIQEVETHIKNEYWNTLVSKRFFKKPL